MRADAAVRVSVPRAWAEVAGAVLMEQLGPFQQVDDEVRAHLLFYPFRFGAGYVPDEDILAALPPSSELTGEVTLERVLVPPGWEEGWKDHFQPIAIGRLYIRAPWEAPPVEPHVHDVVLTPGLAFGTGLHATTRGLLTLMQQGEVGGPVVDAGTGSGILSVAAVRLGYGPVRAFDNDPLAVEAAAGNAAENGTVIQVALHEVGTVPLVWFEGATVFANITANPVMTLLGRLASLATPPRRVLAAGILAGEQEADVVAAAQAAGLRVTDRLLEGEWVSMELVP